jgi:hypothetical protein
MPTDPWKQKPKSQVPGTSPQLPSHERRERERKETNGKRTSVPGILQANKYPGNPTVTPRYRKQPYGTDNEKQKAPRLGIIPLDKPT